MTRIADWPRLYGLIITATGWTRHEVERLTLRDTNELLEYWSEHPPAHLLLAAMVRARPLRKKGELASAVSAVGGSVSHTPNEEIAKLLKEGR